MIIDCDSCGVRGAACGDCVIGVLLGAPDESGPPVVRLDVSERRALDVLADQGLVPRLRLVAQPGHRLETSGGSDGVQRQVG